MKKYDYWCEFVAANEEKVDTAFKAATKEALNHNLWHTATDDGEAYPFIDCLRPCGQSMDIAKDELERLIDTVVSEALTAYMGIKNQRGSASSLESSE